MAAVDPRTEKLLYKNLFNTFHKKAVISSLHRLHLLSQFDYVYILRNGHIVDQGTFEELKRCSLVFKELWEYQAAETAADPAQMLPVLPVELPLVANGNR